jgi:hypothetical protein
LVVKKFFLYLYQITNKTIEIMKLQLKKIYKGRYFKRAGSILITVEKCYLTNKWRGVIENMTHFAKDFDGNEVEMGDTLFEWVDDNKKTVVDTLKTYILNN